MKTKLLFPLLFRVIGYVLAIPGFILGFMVVYRRYEIPGFGMIMRKQPTFFLPAFENFTNELALTLVITGLMFIAFSRIKREDELSARLRLNALYWGVLTNFIGYAVFIIIGWANNIYHTAVVEWLMDKLSNDIQFTIINFFAPLLIFIIRFNYLLYKNNGEYELKEIKLLPNRPFNIIGKVLSGIAIVLVGFGIANTELKTLTNLFLALPVSLLVWMYSKEKNEDEYIKTMRLDAMQIAVYVNYGILLLSNFVCYGADFLMIQMLNLVTIPLIFQIRFQYLLYKLWVQDNRAGSTLSCL